jgi:PAS domain S-box-containing protein
MLYESSSKDQKRILWVAITLMISVSVIVLALTLWMLYRANFEQRVSDLQAMVEAQVSLIDAVARFDRMFSDNDVDGGSGAATLKQIVDGFSRLGGFGESGEFVLGQRRGDKIQFLSEFRFKETGPRKLVPLDTDRAAPMRRALSQERGWMIGPDYRGERVLAAFEPIEELDLGLVAKLDMTEVAAPFMKAAATALGIAAVVVIIGGLLVLRMAKPMVQRIEQSQKRFRTLLESAPDAMVIINASGEIVMVNRRTQELFDFDRDEMLGQPIEMLMPSRFRDRHPERVHAFFAHPSARPMGAGLELFGCTRSGEEFPVEISLSPIETEAGTLVASSLRDISERKEAEEKLKALNENVERQRRTEIALNELSEVLRGQEEMGSLANVIVHQLARYLDLQFVSLFVLTNSNTYSREAAYGYPKEGGIDRFVSGDGLLGQVVVDATPLNVDRVPEYAQLALGLGTISPSSLLVYPLVHDETVVAVLELGGLTPLDDGQQEWLEKASEGLAVTIRLVMDIQQRNRTAKELAEAKEAAESANKAKSGFLANMSHELRTPMNAILGYSEMLIEEAEELDPEDFVPDLKKINEAGNHLLALINDVLDLSKIESGRMDAYTEDFDVSALIDQAASTAQPLMSKNNNQLRIERGDQLGTAHQDLTKLRQSLLNLLSNAAKFTHDGTITLRAERKKQAGAEWLTLSVSDTGIGIPADKIDHVFEEFSQADSSTTRDYGGTGLGLPISRRFCQMLGGDLTVTSITGEGSTFTIRVPVVLPGSEIKTTVQETVPAKTDAELESIRISGAGRTVLVIDDEPEAQEIIERFLRKEGFEVATAGNGEEGLRLAHKLKPAAITLDVMMPEMDGWSVLRALKADPGLQDIPVVMLTMLDDKSKGYSLGATDYLTKPVDRDQLHNALARYYTPGETCSVLLVEDDQPTREVMARTLEKADWSVSEAGNGREALDQLAKKKPQLILLDLMMPVMDGFDFLLEMRANADWQDIPVIVLTAKDLTEEDRKTLSGRVEQIVSKGAHAPDQVVNLVNKVLPR